MKQLVPFITHLVYRWKLKPETTPQVNALGTSHLDVMTYNNEILQRGGISLVCLKAILIKHVFVHFSANSIRKCKHHREFQCFTCYLKLTDTLFCLAYKLNYLISRCLISVHFRCWNFWTKHCVINISKIVGLML